MALEDIVSQKKRLIAHRLKSSFELLAQSCLEAWNHSERDHILQQLLKNIPYAHLLYTLDRNGKQLSATISLDEIESDCYGRNLSDRPYLKGDLPLRGFVLSKVYSSHRNTQPVITALQSIQDDDDNFLGFLAIDFSLLDLPVSTLTDKTLRWSQFRGDPAIRGTLFMQERSTSVMDEYMDDAFTMTYRLMGLHGIFHSKFHFSSSRVTLWQLDDPYNYRIHVLDELLDQDIFLAYSSRAYHEQASISEAMIPLIFERFRVLRQADENIYLRAASLNVMNGMIGLTFSCDGSHYIPAFEFLEKDWSFWFGKELKKQV